MAQTDVLIIGQGICGTFLHWWLEREGLSSIVIDESQPFTASKAAAGLINPVTGRRLVTTWMIEELLPFACETYEEMGKVLQKTFMEPVNMVDFFPTPQMRLAFLDRHSEDNRYLQLPADEHAWDRYFRYELGYGIISPCYLVDMPELLAAGRRWMRERGVLKEERFELAELVVAENGLGRGTGVRYRDIDARWVVFCDGVGSVDNLYFSRLPFAPNKGEALIVEIEGWAGEPATVFKKGMSLTPWRDGLYWVGSSYEWSFDHDEPTEAFRVRTEAILREWLKLPFRTVQHIASVRPATLERRPFVGLHPVYPAVGILNGMGTKGCSLAPYFAQQLAQHLVKGAPMQPDADVRRFKKVLSR